MEALDMTTVLVFLVIFLITVLWYFRPKSDIPGPTSWPIVGTIFECIKLTESRNRDRVSQEFAKKYGRIYRLFMGSYQLVFVNDYDLALEVLKTKGKDFIHRPNFIPGQKRLRQMTTGGFGVANANDDEWRDRRKFAMKTMRDFGVGKSSMEENILDEVENIADDLQKSNQGEITDMRHRMCSASCNVIHRLIFGFRYKHGDPALENILHQFSQIFGGNGGILSVANFFPFLALFNSGTKQRFKAFTNVSKYIKDQISEHRQSYDHDNIRDFVDMFLEAERDQSESKTVLDPTALFNIIVDMFAAGTDTTSTTLDWSVLYMMTHPDVQKRCQDELNKVVGEGRHVKLSDRKNLLYVEATLMEIQRLANTATTSLPHVAVEETTLAGYKIPKNTIVIPSLMCVHHQTSIWKDPENFRPERFLDENNEIINKEYLIPFSAGPRVCLGENLAKAELFLIFTNLIQRFTFSKVDANDVISFEGVMGVTRTAIPYRVKAIPR